MLIELERELSDLYATRAVESITAPESVRFNNMHCPIGEPEPNPIWDEGRVRETWGNRSARLWAALRDAHKEFLRSCHNSTARNGCANVCTACPFTITEESESAQNYGCLPTPEDIAKLMEEHESNWSCHEQDGKICAGYVEYCKEHGVIYKNRPLFRSATYLRTGKKLTMLQEPES